MIGMGGTGSGNEDPVLAVMRVLGDPASYLTKYDDLVKQTIAAKQATEELIKTRAAADVVIAKAASDVADLATARAMFEATASNSNADLTGRENAVVRREGECTVREMSLTMREAALVKETAKASDEIDAKTTKLNTKTAEQNALLDRRKTSLDDIESENKQKLRVRSIQLAEREEATEQLNKLAAEMKTEYEHKLATLRAIVG